MEKTMTLNLRVNPTVKQQAEDVLKQLGIPMATAIDMYLRQITMTGGIPFSLSLPKAPAALNADTMTDDQLHAALQVGIKEIQNGDTVDAALDKPVFFTSRVTDGYSPLSINCSIAIVASLIFCSLSIRFTAIIFS